jgi:hypothetical protein
MPEPTPQKANINRTFDYGHTYSRNYDQVKQEFSQLNVGPINTACTEWAALARNLGTIAEQIRTDIGNVLHDAWESKSSADAQQQLQVAQGTAEALANHSMTMARATDYAYQYASWYQAHLPGDGYVTTGGDSQRAVDHLVKLLGRYDEVIALLPPEVQAQAINSNPQDIGRPDDTPGGPGAGKGPGGMGKGAMPAGGLPDGSGLDGAGVGDPGLGNPGFDTGTGTGTGDPGIGNPGTGGLGSGSGTGFNPYDPGSRLAGSGGLGGLGSGHPGGLGAGGLGSGGVGSGLGPGGIGGGPGAGGVGSGAGALGAGRGGPGSGPGGSGSGSAGAAGRGAGGVGGAPMHGGGHGGDEEERERSTWLTEDEDVWGGNTDVPPPVIGG